MKFKYSYLLLILFLFPSCAKEEIKREPASFVRGEFLDDWTYNVFVEEGRNTAFRLWIPENTTPRAILVLAPGNASSGLTMVNLTEWREYAKKEQLAVIGSYATSSSDNNNNNLIYALEQISNKQALPNLLNLPFLLRGHSSGGGFAYHFAAGFPNKTLAYSNIKGSLSNYNFAMPPGLLIIGAKDLPQRNKYITEGFYSQRVQKSLICLATERLGEHGVGDNDELVRTFFTEILKTRFNTNNELIDISIENTFLGNNETNIVLDYKNYLTEKDSASVLVTEKFKNEWLIFVNK